jgi:hypothetical protein
MATLSQRLDALDSALLNRATTTAQRQRLVQFICAERGLAFASLTLAQQGELLLDYAREQVLGPFRAFEGRQAGTAADSAKRAEVAAEFTPTAGA